MVMPDSLSPTISTIELAIQESTMEIAGILLMHRFDILDVTLQAAETVQKILTERG